MAIVCVIALAADGLVSSLGLGPGHHLVWTSVNTPIDLYRMLAAFRALVYQCRQSSQTLATLRKRLPLSSNKFFCYFSECPYCTVLLV